MSYRLLSKLDIVLIILKGHCFNYLKTDKIEKNTVKEILQSYLLFVFHYKIIIKKAFMLSVKSLYNVAYKNIKYFM